MNGSLDQQLAQIAGQPAASVSDVIDTLLAMDGLLPADDGLKWFVKLYIQVSTGVRNDPVSSNFRDAAWVNRLDVVFANIFFSTLAAFLNGTAAPKSWQALFEARGRVGIDRIQFALAGMNAHINHDLALALLQTNQERQINPNELSPQHVDFENVNQIIEAALPESLKLLATDPLGQLAQDTGKIGAMLATWNVRAARDMAWDFEDHLRNLQGLTRQVALSFQDKITGALGRSLLIPIA